MKFAGADVVFPWEHTTQVGRVFLQVVPKESRTDTLLIIMPPSGRVF